MTVLLLLPAILSFLLLGAHYLRQDSFLLVGMCLVMPCLLVIRHRYILRSLLVLTSMEWVLTAWEDAQQRMAEQQPFLRMVAILCGVGAFAILAALLMQARRVKARYPIGGTAAQGFPLEDPPTKDLSK